MQIDRRSSRGGPWAARLGDGLIEGCASLASPPPLTGDSDITRSQPQLQPQPQPLEVGVDPYRALNRASSNAQQYGAGADKQAALLDEGFSLMRYRYNAYFASLGKAAKNFRFARKETTLPSNLVLGMFGSMNTAPEAILNNGALLAFRAASMDSYEDAYIGPPQSIGVVPR